MPGRIDQFQKNPSAIGQMYVSPDIPTLVEKSLRKEFSYAGYKISNDKIDFTKDKPDVVEKIQMLEMEYDKYNRQEQFIQRKKITSNANSVAR